MLSFLLFVTSVIASQTRIRTIPGRFGTPCIHATVRNTQVIQLRIAFGSDSIVRCEGARFDDFSVASTETDGIFENILDVHDLIMGGRASFESFVAIGRGSHLRNLFGSISVLYNDQLVLRSTSSEFRSSCVDGSYMAIPLIDETFNGTIVSEGLSYNVTFELESSPSGKLVAVPSEIQSRIRNRMTSSGALAILGPTRAGQTRFVFTHCTSDVLASLPDVNLGFAGFGSINLSPQDYVIVDDVNQECFLGFLDILAEVLDVSPHGEWGYSTFNPLEIPGVNVRVSVDLLEICDSA